MARRFDYSSVGPLFNDLLQRGYSPTHAAAIAGNFAHESGARGRVEYNINELKPVVPGSRGGFGVAQWTGPRRRELEAFAAKNGLNVADRETQMKFFDKERTGSEKAAFDRLAQTKDLRSATDSFMRHYERPGVPGLNSRLAHANEILKQYNAGNYQAAQTNTQVASAKPEQQQARLADSPAFKQVQPATVAAKPATQQQIAQPNIQPPVKQSILDKLNPIQPAYAGNQPKSDTLSRINPKDPSGPLLPAPVNGAAATTEQIARPSMSPFDRMRQMHYDSALNREAMDNPRFGKLGMAQSPEGVAQFARPMDSQFRPSNLGLSNDRAMLPETPYAVNMAGSQEALQYAPPPDPTLQPVQMSQEHMAPFQPNMPTQQVTPLTEVNLPATDMPTVTPETYSDPGPTFQMPAEAPIEMPSVGGDMGGGEGMDMSGLMDAFSNLGGGGGGEGGGGGGGQQPSGGGANAIADNFSIPDFPSATLGIGQQIAAQGQLANQPVPIQIGGQNMFNIKPIGMAGQQQMQDMSQAPLATKRLFQG